MVWGDEESRGAEHEVRGMHLMPQGLLSAFRAGHIGSAEEQGAKRRPHFCRHVCSRCCRPHALVAGGELVGSYEILHCRFSDAFEVLPEASSLYRRTDALQHFEPADRVAKHRQDLRICEARRGAGFVRGLVSGQHVLHLFHINEPACDFFEEHGSLSLQVGSAIAEPPVHRGNRVGARVVCTERLIDRHSKSCRRYKATGSGSNCCLLDFHGSFPAQILCDMLHV